ncbi:MAG: tRNA (adenosine(37)-N6)-dimethylallyltransferase MiaA [Bacillota bacterium]|nr:tRNA (adenosine(37)-N6)-dimethylallyltransferase MiaA [Bacillota bacterium]
MPPKIVIICGPTATGKTRLGVALAKKLNGEVISADSMQIYRHMAIGTARPSEEEMEGVPHHMMAVADPWENYSVARYVEEASACVDDVLARGKVPLLVGGTGLYIDALCAGRTFSAFRPESGHRERLRKIAARGGLPDLWRDLRRIDPEAAEKLHPNDEKRIIRALEVWYETGETITEHNRKTQAIPPRYEALTITLTYRDRQALYDRIDQRVDGMMAQGLAREVRELLAMGVPREATAMQAIGYKELADAVANNGDLAAAAETVKLRSRQYAKRQLSWFRRNPEAHWIFLENNPDFPAVVQDSTNFLREKGLP